MTAFVIILRHLPDTSFTYIDITEVCVMNLIHVAQGKTPANMAILGTYC